MDTQNTSTDQIAEALKTVTARLRVNDYAISSLQATRIDSGVRVSVQASQPQDVHRLAAYFQLYDFQIFGNDTIGYAAESLIGAPGVTVDVFGPAPVREPVSA